MATTGNNGDNETNIGFSKLISFSLYDENKTEVDVKNLNNNITYWIPKDPSASGMQYKYINAINMSNPSWGYNQSLINNTNSSTFMYSNGYIVNGFSLNGTNISVHIQIKPDKVSNSIAYLFLLKFGSNPVTTAGKTFDFDEGEIFCSSGNL